MTATTYPQHMRVTRLDADGTPEERPGYVTFPLPDGTGTWTIARRFSDAGIWRWHASFRPTPVVEFEVHVGMRMTGKWKLRLVPLINVLPLRLRKRVLMRMRFQVDYRLGEHTWQRGPVVGVVEKPDGDLELAVVEP